MLVDMRNAIVLLQDLVNYGPNMCVNTVLVYGNGGVQLCLD